MSQSPATHKSNRRLYGEKIHFTLKIERNVLPGHAETILNQVQDSMTIRNIGLIALL